MQLTMAGTGAAICVIQMEWPMRFRDREAGDFNLCVGGRIQTRLTCPRRRQSVGPLPASILPVIADSATMTGNERLRM